VEVTASGDERRRVSRKAMPFARRILLRTALAGSTVALSRPALTQANVIRLVCPSAPGGVTDLITRIVQPALAQHLGRTIVVDNRPGAGGNLAAAFVAQAPADGSIIMVASGGLMALNPLVFRTMPFDPLRDIRLVSRLTAGTFLLAVHAGTGVTDVAGLIEYLKRKGDAANFGSPGIGYIPHLGAEMFLVETGTTATHVPYRGSVGAINALASGEVDFLFDSRGPLAPHLQSGAVRVIANGGTRPDLTYPDLPMLSRTMPGVVVQSWTAMAGPAGMPEEFVRRLDAATRAALQDPGVVERLREVANGPAYLDTAELDAFYAEERRRLAHAVQVARVTPQ
jgi:tripartite-type tricarboxylate transporter receptor subunit TctC